MILNGTGLNFTYVVANFFIAGTISLLVTIICFSITLEQGLLFFVKGKYITVMLLSSKASKALRSCLASFTESFEARYKKELESGTADLAKFYSANELIEQYFANIPSYTG